VIATVFGLTLEEAARLHGHKGPWLVIGYRAGMRAREILKPETEHDLTCVAKVPKKVPYTCSVDGIQASAGCTLGKLTIGITDSNSIEFEFTHRASGKKVLLKLRKDIPKLIESKYREGGLEAAAKCVEDMELQELFEEVITQ